MTKTAEVAARAICRVDNPCWSMVAEIFENEAKDSTGRTHGDYYREQAQAALTALKEAGYAVVPVEPKRSMCVSGSIQAHQNNLRVSHKQAADIYRAMISAGEKE